RWQDLHTGARSAPARRRGRRPATSRSAARRTRSSPRPSRRRRSAPIRCWSCPHSHRTGALRSARGSECARDSLRSVVVAAAFCPYPPLLVPALAGGAAAELDDLLAACDPRAAPLDQTVAAALRSGDPVALRAV